LLVSLSPGTDGDAHGRVYLDDGESLPPTAYREIEILASGGKYGGKISFVGEGTYVSRPKLQKVVVLVNDVRGEQEAGSGVTEVWVGGETWKSWSWDGKLGKLVVERVGIDLNGLALDTISWR
jgi:alpha-glucosidase